MLLFGICKRISPLAEGFGKTIKLLDEVFIFETFEKVLTLKLLFNAESTVVYGPQPVGSNYSC
jgi:hypothetical protein